MTQPTGTSSRIYLEFPPALAQYLERGRNVWLQSSPKTGNLSFLGRPGFFQDLEFLAVERKQLLAEMGMERCRSFCFRLGFEQGRREAARHFGLFEKNIRLAMQAGTVFNQLRGLHACEVSQLEYQPEDKHIYRKLELERSSEAIATQMVQDTTVYPVCWLTSGYYSGHLSELLGRRVLTLESACIARGDRACTFESKMDTEWGGEAEWAREAFRMKGMDQELAERDALVANAERLAERARNALATIRTQRRSPQTFDELVAECDAMRQVIRRARQSAASDLSVLLLGHPGSGRETLARSIHNAGSRKSGPFVSVDCTTFRGEALKRHLTGFMKGAFQGAVMFHEGLLVKAHGGTLYLSELTELDLETQGILLRTIQDGAVTPIGSDRPTTVQIRLIAASTRDIESMVRKGTIREDLYYALSIATIRIPDLHERDTDILLLAETFLRDLRERYDKPTCTLTDEARKALFDFAWPGNIRQLQSTLEHAVVFSQGPQITLEDFPDEVLASRLRRNQDPLSEEVVRAALRRANGNRSRAADLLGAGRTTLWRKMKEYGIDKS